jgi:hypothetical protein
MFGPEARSVSPPPTAEPDVFHAGAAEADLACLAVRAALDRITVVLAASAAAFAQLRAWHVFGFARLEDHARERFGRSGRWLRDLAVLGEGLSRSAPLSAALTGADGGRPLGRVAATLIARACIDPAHHPDSAGASSNIEAWIEAARALSVRDLREAIRQARAAESSSADDDPASDLLRLPVPLPVLAAFDEALELHRCVEGRSSTVTEFVEALVGEAQSSGLPDASAGLTAPIEPGVSEARIEAALRHATAAWADLPPPHTETSSAPASSLEQLRDLESVAGTGDAAELDRQVRALVAIENDLEARLGEVLAAVAERRDWRRLAFAGVGHYAEERLGMSRSRAGERARLARALRTLPAVAAACASGRITLEAASLINRMLGDGSGEGGGTGVSPELEAAWVEHASLVTIKRMRDEARAAGRYRVRPHGAPGPRAPLSDADWSRSLRREAGTATRRILAFGRMAASAGAQEALAASLEASGPAQEAPGARGSTGSASTASASAEPDVFHSRLREPDVSLRLRLPADLADDFLATIAAARDGVEARAAAVPWDVEWPPGDPDLAQPREPILPSLWAARISFVRGRRVPMWAGLLALLEDFAVTWDNDAAAPGRRDDRIFIRDGWRCSAPGCSSRRHLECHHIVYRSHGGDEDDANKASLCRFHHQRGEHGGLLQVRGRAPTDLAWRLGRRDVGVDYRNERLCEPVSTD